MNGHVKIVATGARTPVGLQSASTAAAVRAGITRLADHPFMVDQVGDPMPAAMDRELDPAILGFQRQLELASTALQEVAASVKRSGRLRIPLYLGLPEFRPGFSEKDAEEIRFRLTHQDLFPFEYSEVTILCEGHAAGLAALQLGVDRIERGDIDACLVGGIESYFHPDTMEWLDENRQLVGAVSRSGFVPGEGAGFCMLMTESAARRYGLQPLATVRSVATGRETKLIKTSEICLGEGLTATVQEAMRDLHVPAEAVNHIICDMNSERYRGEEWGFVCLRLPHNFENPTGYLSPADCWGDVGAASGPLFAMLACQGAQRGYLRGSRSLLWASSERGLRGAAVLEFGSGSKAALGSACYAN